MSSSTQTATSLLLTKDGKRRTGLFSQPVGGPSGLAHPRTTCLADKVRLLAGRAAPLACFSTLEAGGGRIGCTAFGRGCGTG